MVVFVMIFSIGEGLELKIVSIFFYLIILSSLVKVAG